MKPFWEITDAEASSLPGGHHLASGHHRVLPRRRILVALRHARAACRSPCRASIWSRGWGRCCRSPKAGPSTCRRKVHDALDQRTNPTWPTTWFAPRLTGQGAFSDGYTVMNAWGANHGAFSYGHVGADLMALASMLRIPVSMHNVPEEQIFRPSAWTAFGTADLEGADFRACATSARCTAEDAWGPRAYNGHVSQAGWHAPKNAWPAGRAHHALSGVPPNGRTWPTQSPSSHPGEP